MRIEAVNDSRLIGICIYNVFLLSALGVALNTVLQKQVDLLYGINSGFIIFGTTVTQCVLFVPKVRSMASLSCSNFPDREIISYARITRRINGFLMKTYSNPILSDMNFLVTYKDRNQLWASG